MIRGFGRFLLRAAAVAIAIASMSSELSGQYPAEWTTPFPAFRIAGNLYYVGSRGLASYLVTTPSGHVLINSNLESSVPLLRASVESLGFRFTDIRILLISHAHWDHNAGSAAIKAMTGAQYFVMEGDVGVVESGGRTDYQYGSLPASRYAPTKVDRVLRDRDEVRLGGVVLVAHLTPGHTPGCTTWTLQVREGSATYTAVIVGSPNVNPGTRLAGNTSYPDIASDYARTFQRLGELSADLFLGAHGSYFDLERKYSSLKPGGPNPFVDPQGYRQYVTDKEREFRAALARQRAEREQANRFAPRPVPNAP